MPGSVDTFVKGDMTVVVTNSRAGVLMSAEIKQPDGTVTLVAKRKLKWEVVASWLKGVPEDMPAPVFLNSDQRHDVENWAGEPDLDGGHLYRSALKMTGEIHGWTVSSARLPGGDG